MKIVFEGLPGAGKSTLARVVADHFGCPLIEEWAVFTEPRWKSFSLVKDHYQANDELKDYLAHMFSGPVVLDRHYLGALAYARNQSEQEYRKALRWYREAQKEERLHPADLVVLLEIDGGLSLQRQPRAGAHEAYSGEQNLQRIKKYYEEFFREVEPATRVEKVDAIRPLDEVKSEVISLLAEFL